jgi:chemotaxis protein methyltransferase CheR
VTLDAVRLALARRALEGTYGLALEGLSQEQIAAAFAAAGGGADGDAAFLARVVDRLPIDESWLFRDDGLWEWLRDEAGPELLARAGAVGRPVRILSLGCSAGQEPFSVAMLFLGLLERAGVSRAAAASRVEVVGLDSSPARVAAAREGAVPGWSVLRCRPDWIEGRVSPEEGPAGRFRIAPAVRALCRFDVGNLVELAAAPAALAGFDLVLCRHVLIYFRPAEAERIAGALARGLDAGAYLVFSAPEAHLVDAGGLARSPYLGVGQSGGAAAPAPVRATSRARRVRPPPLAPSRRPEPARASHPVPAAPDRSAAARVSSHVEVALRHAGEGRADDALREARAALFHDPGHLYSRLLVGQQLINRDRARGSEVLRELLTALTGLDADEAVPCAEGLSVGQLAAAARILLARPEGA